LKSRGTQNSANPLFALQSPVKELTGFPEFTATAALRRLSPEYFGLTMLYAATYKPLQEITKMNRQTGSPTGKKRQNSVIS
jgi:hypothetical protein